MASGASPEYPETVHFYGQVLPTLVSISIERTRNITWNIPERDLSMRLLAKITDSKIHVEIHASKYSVDIVPVFYNCAFDISRTAVELVAFKLGLGVIVQLTEFEDPYGDRKMIAGPHNENLSALCKSYDLTNGFEEMWEIIQSNTHLFGVLNDLIAAIAIPHVSVVNCARAMDGIKNIIAGNKNDWKPMRDVLRVSKEYLQLITSTSKGHRHGYRNYVDGPTVTKILERCWVIMDRFLEYLKRASGPLPEAEFPRLEE